MLKIVLDTNNLVSTQISKKGASAKIYKLWKENKIEIFTSPFQLKELKRVLGYPRIKKKYRLSRPKINRIVQIVRRQAIVVYPLKIPKIIKEDPSDNHILAIASERKVECIISGDGHLLELGEFRGIPIITAKEFLKEVVFRSELIKS